MAAFTSPPSYPATPHQQRLIFRVTSAQLETAQARPALPPSVSGTTNCADADAEVFASAARAVCEDSYRP